MYIQKSRYVYIRVCLRPSVVLVKLERLGIFGCSEPPIQLNEGHLFGIGEKSPKFLDFSANNISRNANSACFPQSNATVNTVRCRHLSLMHPMVSLKSSIRLCARTYRLCKVCYQCLFTI